MSTGQTASSAAWVNGVLQMFASQGVDTSRLLETAGISPASIAQPHARFDLQQVNRLWQLAVAASGQEALGLDRELVGRFVDLEMASTSMGSGASLRAVLDSQSQYLTLTDDAAAFTIERDHPDVWLVLTHGNDVGFPRQRVEYSMLAMVLACQQAADRPLRLQAAEFVFAEPADAHRHRMAFPCPLRFGRARNRLLVAAEDLEVPVVGGRPSALLREERVLEALLVALGPAHTSFHVAREMVRRLCEGEPVAGAIAPGIGLTDAAMIRQLRAERTSVEQLLDQVRRELAHEYLAGSDVPLHSIPPLLELEDLAAFTAACRRWFEQTPADYRRDEGTELPRS